MEVVPRLPRHNSVMNIIFVEYRDSCIPGLPLNIEVLFKAYTESVGAILKNNRDLSDVIENFLKLFLPMLAFYLLPHPLIIL